MSDRLRRPSPATTIACIALFFAIAGGSAIALEGRNSIDSNDIRRAAVQSGDIADGAVLSRSIRNYSVRARDIARGAIGSGKIRNGRVLPEDLAPVEEPHVVGRDGEPAFGNGGEGDCRHFYVPGGIRIGGPSFYKDPFGRVYMNGMSWSGGVTNQGDETCDDFGEEGDEDSIVFILPEGYRPANDEVFAYSAEWSELLIIGDTPFGSYPAGAVVKRDADAPVLFDGISFRAAAP